MTVAEAKQNDPAADAEESAQPDFDEIDDAEEGEVNDALGTGVLHYDTSS